MSRTYKDRPRRIVWGTWGDDRYYVDYVAEYRDYRTGKYHTVERSVGLTYAGYHPKKKRSADEDWRWCQSTPSWWVRMFMNKPKRRECRLWEQSLKTLADLEDADCPDYGHKPHLYYW
jgi:hypothetical protein